MAITERYVRADAAGGGDGTTDTNSGANGAFTWAEMITDINTPRAGYRYNVKAGVGTYSLGATTTITGDGSTTSPNIIQGFTTTIGDAVRGRLSGGALDDSLMPTIAYSSTYYLAVTGADYLQIRGLKITGDRNGALVHVQTGAVVDGSVCTNASTGSSAVGVLAAVGTTSVVNCDVTMSSGHASSIGVSSVGTVMYNRVNMPASGTGIAITNNSGKPVAFNTVIDGTTGISKLTVGAEFACFSNTVYGCSGDGIDIVTSSTALCYVFNNLIVDCGGYGVDFNTSTCMKILFNNRFRDCAGGNYNGDGDYGAAGKHGDVTTDTGGPETDFVNYAGGDFAMLSGSPGIHKAAGYLLNIGANGTPVASSGGGPLTGGRLVR